MSTDFVTREMMADFYDHEAKLREAWVEPRLRRMIKFLKENPGIKPHPCLQGVHHE